MESSLPQAVQLPTPAEAGHWTGEDLRVPKQFGGLIKDVIAIAIDRFQWVWQGGGGVASHFFFSSPAEAWVAVV